MSEQTPVLEAKDFVHLHNHTHYSVLDGLQKVPEMLDRVKDLGMEAVAITDHGVLSGAIEFYKEATARGIKPIIGIETYVAARKLTDKDPVKDKARYHLILLAMNNKGYENLMRMATTASLDGYYYKPRIDHDLLEKYNEGIICLSACAGSELGENLRADQDEKAYEIAKWYKNLFGDRYYIEVQDHGHPDHPMKWDEQVKLNQKLFKLAADLGIKTVLTSDAHYAAPADKDAHEILLCVQTGAFLSDQDRFSLKDFDLFVEDPKSAIARWGADHASSIRTSKEIADRCEIKFEFDKILIPEFPVPEGQTEKTFLDDLVHRGLVDRYTNMSREDAFKMTIEQARKIIPPHVLERTDFELGVIDGMGFNGYMLIVQDFINWGKDQGIIFGPGRGSAAGSIIAYALRITDLDPLKYGLLFERFLNPDRISMPDIDVDIQDNRRDEVIEYCSNKYGKDRVSNIVTFGKMAARAAVRDVARVLQVPYAEADKLAKMIPAPVQGRHIPLKVSIEKDQDLKAEYENNQTAKRVIDLASRLEGTIRSHGVHACGVVIAPGELVQYIPLEMAQKGVVATQFPMGQIEELGLLKMDFLGLSNLTVIKNALRIIKKIEDVDIDLGKIPLDDLKTFELLARGDTTGVFQFESAGMKRYLRDLKPNEFDDVIAMGALYRPGPLSAGLTDSFIKRKNGLEKVSFAHPLMEGALKNTFGVLVYQEQVMQISRDVCGFTGGEADTLRKAIGKKKLDVMEKMQVKFIEGAVKNGVPQAVIEKFWKDLLGFADYCFNKSHSACYGLISYWTAYLKAHFPGPFMAALMTSDQDDTDRLAIEIAECRRADLQVLTPDINQSFAEFGTVPGTNQIRFGLNAVKNVGTNAVEEILRAREEGKFKSIEDFLKRVNVRIVNRKNLESLVKAGAFDSLADRTDLLYNMDTILAFAHKIQKEAASGQADLFGSLLDEMIPALKLDPAPTRTSDREMLLWERELLGLYLSAHPLDKYDAYFSEQTMPISNLAKEMDGKTAMVGGVINDSRVINTKSGSKMAFVKLEDKAGEMEIIVFPKLYEEISEKLVQDAVVKVKGKINAKDRDGNPTDDVKIIAEEIIFVTDDELDNYKSTGRNMRLPQTKRLNLEPKSKKKLELYTYVPVEEKKPRLFVHVKDPSNNEALVKVKQVFNEWPGSHEVVLVLGEDKKSAIKMPFKVDPQEDLMESLSELLGTECVAVK
ncbi:MAG TPA: DNA polymerase III subunit alpha [Candidatus Saccharimonadales bacterium]|nr:DNA polymerase III subunit alpha [Candidatus Saccharimonadales bacterium]